MPVSSRSCRSPGTCFVALGTCALLVLVVVLTTGGFVLDIGPMRVAALDWRRPLAWAVAAWAVAAIACRRQGFADGTAAIARWLDRHAAALALVMSAAAAGSALAFGTYAASASDASAYVSQAELLASAAIARDEPLARQVDWPEATWAFSPLGYRPGPSSGAIVPTYPPGLPLLMAGARGADEWGPFLVVPFFGAVAVFASYLLGATLHSRTAGLIAATLLATSPIFLFQIVQPMSDVPATALWAGAFVLAMPPRRGAGALLASGAAAGVALLTRPNLVPLALVLAFVAGGWPLGRGADARAVFQRWCLLASGAAPAFGAVLWLQWLAYGSPLTSGHGAVSDLFALANVWPNVHDYMLRVGRGEAPALGLAAAACLALLMARVRAVRVDESSLSGSVRVATATLGALLVCYLPYGVFPDWSYLRFFLPVFPLAFVVVGALLVNASTTLPRETRGIVLLVAVTLAGSVNVQIARAEQAFNLRHYESRYRSVGRYLDAAVPSSAVFLAVQESGSLRYYTHRPVVRWDLLRTDLDAAVAKLAALGRIPILVVEDWESADLRARFPMSELARLDWQPRADIGTTTRVRLFDPRDRSAPAGRIVTDRFE